MGIFVYGYGFREEIGSDKLLSWKPTLSAFFLLFDSHESLDSLNSNIE